MLRLFRVSLQGILFSLMKRSNTELSPTERAMHALLIIFYAIALFVIVEYARIAWHMIISKRMTGSIKKFERHNPDATKRILFIGDSTGHGTGTSHERYSVVGRLGTDFPDTHVENHSETGLGLSRACQILRAIAGAKQSAPFDVVIIMVGGINVVY